MKQIAANRFRLGILIAITAALALGSFWVLEVMRKGLASGAPQQPRSRPDYYVEKFNFVRMAKTGLAQYNIFGEKLVHNPVDDSHEIKLPNVHSLSKERPPMTMQSKRAVVDQDSSRVHMYDNVHVDRPATPTSEHFHLASEYLLLLPDEDVIQTDKPVVITLGTSRLTGIGMTANNATRELRLSSNVHASYQPQPKAAPR
jgi:lipopolysaccharide export system protein LptC